MHILKQSLAELKYLGKLSFKKRKKYLKKCTETLIRCLAELVLNFLYAKKSGISLTKQHIKTLKPHKNKIFKLIRSKNTTQKRKLLGGSPALVPAVLTILASVIATLVDAL